MVKTVKYFKESSFGPITLYTGRMGSGMTLGAVMRMVRASKSKRPPKLIANCTLIDLEYERLNLVNFNRYLQGGPSLILFDSGYRYFASRASLAYIHISFFQNLRHSKSKAILTTSQGPMVIDRAIRDQITDVVFVKSNLPLKGQKLILTHAKLAIRSIWAKNISTGRKERHSEFYWKAVSRCIIKRAGKYFQHYSTFEIPDKEEVLHSKEGVKEGRIC